ncbi:nucleotidyltransferase domain-containing protein [Nostoc sp. FACHB-152]|uniref:nucleotidyltransferase domain-containing protein n=1 Tax=unclassified Nostoc TaxID=2593658 RepID=UPI0016877A40|nr:MULTISPECIES: nucleotidyltransferase domain-containing protein [unclassified Nostoc]MBD2450848.1 nucleotidyltransferase domain-containing protein [Nostoc sp. FACHB-152]MBD2473239.1 nucleotidyltransferase domain-containing protein [Nostoc sp. FACHB-145]
MKRIEIEERTILVGLTGSHGYGLNRPESDFDYRGIFIGQKEHYLGFSVIEQKDSGWDEPGLLSFLDNNKDTCLYELKKYIKLAQDANPNILELLWLDNYLVLTEVGQHLVNNRQIFLSKKVKHTFTGYSHAQLRKIESHRKWLLNPPQKKPTPTDFGIEEEPLSKDNINAFLEYLYVLIRGKIEYLEESEQLYQLLTADIDFKGFLKQHNLGEDAIEYTQQLTKGSDDFFSSLRKSQAYRTALREWEAYLSWQKNRNPNRAEMEKKSGFDTKHAMHLIRLLKCGMEILQTGVLTPNRQKAGDAQLLKSILNGDLTYAEVISLADELEKEIEVAYNTSSLPHRPNTHAINELCMDLVQMRGW